jgi:membrane-associated phospholipid phosphatase
MTARLRRRTVFTAGIVLVILIGVCRVVLGVHWATDVVAGCALGTAVAAAVLAVPHGSPSVPRHPVLVSDDGSR